MIAVSSEKERARARALGRLGHAPNLAIVTLQPSVDWRRGVAQLAEHRSPKPGVAGSSPAAPAFTKCAVCSAFVRFRGALRVPPRRYSPCEPPCEPWVGTRSPRPLSPRWLQSPRRSQSSRRTSYTVIGSPERPRPGPRAANPRLAARRRDGSFAPPLDVGRDDLDIGTAPEVIDGCFHRLDRDAFLRRSSVTHQPASTSSGAIPSMP